jgi:hypothetical protein
MKHARLIEVDFSLTQSPNVGRFRERFHPVEAPQSKHCQCGRVIVWDASCLQCQKKIE